MALINIIIKFIIMQSFFVDRAISVLSNIFFCAGINANIGVIPHICNYTTTVTL